MKSKYCRDCIYATSLDKRRYCSLNHYYVNDIRTCPMGYVKADFELADNLATLSLDSFLFPLDTMAKSNMVKSL